MVDAQDLGSCVLRRVGSSPISRTFCSLIASFNHKLKSLVYRNYNRKLNRNYSINIAFNSGKSALKALPR